MDSYPLWQEFKTYQSHIKRLRDINGATKSARDTKSYSSYQTHRLNTTRDGAGIVKLAPCPNSVSPNSKQQQGAKSQAGRKMSGRTKTEPLFKKTQVLHSPIPLVSEKESSLIKGTLNSRAITLREKEKLLENYLLGRRILETKPVIRNQDHKRQFRLHRKVSSNMSRSRNHSHYSQERLENYKEYEREKGRSQQIIVGAGLNELRFQIIDVLLVKGVLASGKQVAYNIKICAGKQRHEIKALSHTELHNKEVRLNFKRSMLLNSPEIKISLYSVRQNNEQEIGILRLNLIDFEVGRSKVYHLVKNKFPVGTAEIKGELTLATSKLT